MDNRDDFSQKTKDILCERVGGKCSNPDCRCETKGPHSDLRKRVSKGVAAHITAASEGGPRYDPNISSEQRKSIDNGIWLCNSCATMIDSDEIQYPVELLRFWKSKAEYDQFCAINQKNNLSEINREVERRKDIACRKTKEVLEDLHSILQYAYEYWKLNFAGHFREYELENELEAHWMLYKDKLEQINTYEEKKTALRKVTVEYSLDLGPQLCKEIDEYCSSLNFIFQSDCCGIYNNYWSCFFEMISKNISLVDEHKKVIDSLLYQRYLIP